MFRIQNNSSSAPRRLNYDLPALWKNKKVQVWSLSVIVLVAAYFTWTHGRLLPGQWKGEVLQAQASSPLPPEWLERYFGKSYCLQKQLHICGPDADPDRDGLTNWEEFLFFTDPTNPDTDGDGLLDGEEVRNLTNPLGSGYAFVPRDVNDLAEYNPLTDALVQRGLSEIEKGNVMTFEQIADAAARLTYLPTFSEVPFLMTAENNQQLVNNYMGAITHVTDEFQSKPVVRAGSGVLDSGDLHLVSQYVDALIDYHNALVFIEVPSELFVFHKAFYGSLVFQALIANTQAEYLQGLITEIRAQDMIRLYTIYHARFVQEMGKEADRIKEKYQFYFSLDTNQN